MATPVQVTGHLLLQSVTIRNMDTSDEHTWNWSLYEQRLNNGDAAENVLDQIAYGTSAETFTAAAISSRTIDAASGPVYLGPGLYWLVIQNEHASTTLGVGVENGNGMNAELCQTKTLAGTLGTTLDFVAATWTRVSKLPGCRLNGRVFGQTAKF